MQQIVLTIDQLRPGMPASGLACYLKELHDTQLTCVYLKPAAKSNSVEGRFYALKKDTEMYFDRRGVNSRHIEADSDAALQVLGSYADVIILDANTSFDHKAIAGPSKTLKHILRRTNCPVFIAPQTFEGITELLYCHDGTAAGFYALKQLTYLFPSFGQYPLTVFTLGERPILNEMDLMKEWLKTHYTSVTIKSAGGADKKHFFKTLQQKDDVLLVFGAYSRNTFSQWIRRSHADFFMQFFNASIFIAHP